MSQFIPSLPLVLVALSAFWTTSAYGQDKAAPTPAPGWGSAWMEPANAEARQMQSTVRQVMAAQHAGNSSVALALCDRQLQATPNSAEPYALRAALYSQLKRYDAALEDVARARSIAQTNQRTDETAKLLTLAAALHEHKRDYASAVDDLKASLKLDRYNSNALNSLAWLRATAPDGAFRNGREGVDLAKRALALEAGEDSCVVTDTLAAAYAESNDFTRAVECERRALHDAEKEIKDASKAKDFEQRASDRLKLFEQSRPYHAELP